MRNANPSLNPANNGSLAGMLESSFNKLMQGVSDMLPAKVIAYDRETNRAQVQPLIAILTTDGTTVPRAQYASIPVLQLGGGGFLLSFNLLSGSLGWIKANDRDMSLFLQSYAEAQPNTYRTHSFSDGLFIPDVMTGYSISEEDEENAVLQSLDGTVKVSLGVGKITISAPVVEIDGETEITLNAPEINVTAPVTTWTGNFNVIGNITATGSITPGV